VKTLKGAVFIRALTVESLMLILCIPVIDANAHLSGKADETAGRNKADVVAITKLTSHLMRVREES
jgi:hypothetical protein